MIRKTKKARKYQAPIAKETHLALESNFCETDLFNIRVQELEGIYHKTDGTADAEPTYFEF